MSITYKLHEADDCSVDDQSCVLLDGKPTAYAIQHCDDPDVYDDDTGYVLAHYFFDTAGQVTDVRYLGEHDTLADAKAAIELLIRTALRNGIAIPMQPVPEAA